MQINVLGRRMGYIENGQGLPIVLIHGFPLNKSIWQAQLSALAPHGRVIAPDLRGFGESAMPEGTVEISTYADDIRELLDSLGVNEPAIVVGHSMGGYVALAYLRSYPDHVAGVVLTNTKATADTLEGKAGRDKNINIAKEKGAAGIAEGMLPKLLAPSIAAANPALVEQLKDTMLTATVPGIIGALGAMRDRPDSTSTLLEFSQQVLIVAGAEDPLMSAADQSNMKQAARNSALVTIPNSAHLTPVEQPEAFNHAVIEYLRMHFRD